MELTHIILIICVYLNKMTFTEKDYCDKFKY